MTIDKNMNNSNNTNKFRRAGHCLLFLLLFLLLFSAPFGARANAPTRLFFNPTPLSLDTDLNPSGTLPLEVADGVNLFAFDLFVRYDPTLARVNQVEVGDFLGENLMCVDQVNQPGLVHFSCTRFGVSTGVSGSGVLLELTFEALGPGGDSILSLTDSEIYDWPDTLPVDLTLEDGALSVRPYRIFLPLVMSANGQKGEALP